MRRLAWWLGGGALLLALALAAIAWILSDRMLVPRPYSLMPEFAIRAVGEGTVTLPAPGDAPAQFARTDARGAYGLRYEGGAGRLGAIRARDDAAGTLTRDFRRTRGVAPVAGAEARLDVTVHCCDPGEAHGLPFEPVTVDAPVGPVPAWWLDRGAERAALMLHGRRRADRTETLRSLPLYLDAGLSVLVSSYRNHDDAPPDPSGLYHYGAAEGADAAAALAFLAEQGVREVVLVGFSMGAAVAAEAMAHAPAGSPRVVGMVLEAPLVDPRPVIRQGARQAGLPLAGPLADLGLAVARLRTGVAWRTLDLRRRAPAWTMPVLAIAGTADATVPIGLVDELVARLPGPVRYARYPGVDHMEAWNAAPARYERTVAAFLNALPAVGEPARAVR